MRIPIQLPIDWSGRAFELDSGSNTETATLFVIYHLFTTTYFFPIFFEMEIRNVCHKKRKNKTHKDITTNLIKLIQGATTKYRCRYYMYKWDWFFDLHFSASGFKLVGAQAWGEVGWPYLYLNSLCSCDGEDDRHCGAKGWNEEIRVVLRMSTKKTS